MNIEPVGLVTQNPYTAEELAGVILQIAIKLNYIDRKNLTAKGEQLLSGAEKHERDRDRVRSLPA